MSEAAEALTLQRSVTGRLLGGARLQALVLVVAVLLLVRAVGQLAGAIDDPSLPLGATLAVLAALLVVMAVAASGYARADDTGITWRQYLPHHVAWGDIRGVALTVRGTGVGGVRHAIVVTTAHRTLVVTPACSAGPDRTPFGRALLTRAAEHGIAVQDGWR